ncbi:MAG: hypothetical protein ACXWTQ_09610 [Methylococcaceae bacterium]
MFFATLSGLYWAFGEAAVYYEMWATNTLTREALADDLGLGMVEILVVSPLSVLGAAVAVIIVWCKMPKRVEGEADA